MSVYGCAILVMRLLSTHLVECVTPIRHCNHSPTAKQLVRHKLPLVVERFVVLADSEGKDLRCGLPALRHTLPGPLCALQNAGCVAAAAAALAAVWQGAAAAAPGGRNDKRDWVTQRRGLATQGQGEGKEREVSRVDGSRGRAEHELSRRCHVLPKIGQRKENGQENNSKCEKTQVNTDGKGGCF